MDKLKGFGIENIKMLKKHLEDTDLHLLDMLTSDEIEEIKHIPELLEYLKWAVERVNYNLRHYTNAIILKKPKVLNDDDRCELEFLIKNGNEHMKSKELKIYARLINDYGSDMINSLFIAEKSSDIAKLEKLKTEYEKVYKEHADLLLRYMLLDFQISVKDPSVNLNDIYKKLYLLTRKHKHEINKYNREKGKCKTVMNNPIIKDHYNKYLSYGNGIIEEFIDNFYMYCSIQLEYNLTLLNISLNTPLSKINEYEIDLKRIIHDLNESIPIYKERLIYYPIK
jgi:hypothetical protein